ALSSPVQPARLAADLGEERARVDDTTGEDGGITARECHRSLRDELDRLDEIGSVLRQYAERLDARRQDRGDRRERVDRDAVAEELGRQPGRHAVERRL